MDLPTFISALQSPVEILSKCKSFQPHLAVTRTSKLLCLAGWVLLDSVSVDRV